jgi:hypothetical protein
MVSYKDNVPHCLQLYSPSSALSQAKTWYPDMRAANHIYNPQHTHQHILHPCTSKTRIQTNSPCPPKPSSQASPCLVRYPRNQQCRTTQSSATKSPTTPSLPPLQQHQTHCCPIVRITAMALLAVTSSPLHHFAHGYPCNQHLHTLNTAP